MRKAQDPHSAPRINKQVTPAAVAARQVFSGVPNSTELTGLWGASKAKDQTHSGCAHKASANSLLAGAALKNAYSL
jgi:hypothetical protein